MHALVVAGTFLAMIAAPCIVAMFRKDEEESI
jgi:hypothetical protein